MVDDDEVKNQQAQLILDCGAALQALLEELRVNARGSAKRNVTPKKAAPQEVLAAAVMQEKAQGKAATKKKAKKQEEG